MNSAQGLALNIGLNSVDPGSYDGWSGRLTACEADALDMAQIADGQGFTHTLLLTKKATRAAVLDALQSAAGKLKHGDIFFLSYSGHGGQLPDRNGDEPDGLDETWCLYDGELVDDEIYAALGDFNAGVRIIVLSDSCHSGSVIKAAFHRGRLDLKTSNAGKDGVVYRCMPGDVARRTYRTNQPFYDKILSNQALSDTKANITASAILISGCQDNQLSADGPFNGAFTSEILSVWKGGLFTGSYARLHQDVVKRMPPDQQPNYFTLGAVNKQFESQKPFSI